MPTILSLGNIDVKKAMKELQKDHTEVHPPVGRDLTPLILDDNKSSFENEPIYFMTDDDPSRTLNHANPLGIPIEPVTQPCHLETVIVKLPTGKNNRLETWKHTRYFDNPSSGPILAQKIKICKKNVQYPPHPMSVPNFVLLQLKLHQFQMR